MTTANSSRTLFEELTWFPKPDARTDDWLFMQTPSAVVAICAVYLVITWKGPKWMEHRPPMKFSNLMFAYNIFLVGVSAYITIECIWVAIQENYSLIKCNPVDYSTKPLPMRMASVIWWYFLSKIIELLDSIFFIIRKKNNQLTFLHVYHHSSMPIVTWIASRYIDGGAKFLPCAFNSFVHIIMYAYYALSALGPGIQKYLWWKKYITRLQLLQFMCVMLHSVWALTLYPCDFPKLVNIWLIFYSSTFLVLFGNFYLKAYTTKKDRKDKKHEE